MYLNYWQLARRPFGTGIDESAYYPSESHQSSLLKLRYAIEEDGAVAVLGGTSGTGKTLLVRLLANRMDESRGPWLHVVFPQLSTHELLAYIAAELEAPPESTVTLDRAVREIGRRLLEHAAQGRRAVLVIDEAHLLPGPQTLDTLRLLLNFEYEQAPALTLLLVGQPGLLPWLERVPQFDERVAVKCLLKPLTIEETMSYVQHRLARAGATRTIFTVPALEALHHASLGVPRRIHRIADLALLVGFADEQRQITERHVETVCEETRLLGADA